MDLTRVCSILLNQERVRKAPAEIIDEQEDSNVSSSQWKSRRPFKGQQWPPSSSHNRICLIHDWPILSCSTFWPLICIKIFAWLAQDKHPNCFFMSLSELWKFLRLASSTLAADDKGFLSAAKLEASRHLWQEAAVYLFRVPSEAEAVVWWPRPAREQHQACRCSLPLTCQPRLTASLPEGTEVARLSRRRVNFQQAIRIIILSERLPFACFTPASPASASASFHSLLAFIWPLWSLFSVIKKLQLNLHNVD